MVELTRDNGTLRTFASGATRDTAEGKIDPEGFFDPMVISVFSDYMGRHRAQSDGSLRASDNWQCGFPRAQIMKSLWRHFLDLWLLHRGHPPASADHRLFYDHALHDGGIELARETARREILCALYFNVGAYLREVILGRSVPEQVD